MFDVREVGPLRNDAPVLGIDPGVSRCGYGAVRRTGSTMEAVAYGVIRTAADDLLPDRLAQLLAELETLVREVRPCAMAVERVLFQNNTRTAMSVGQASGLALVVAARAGIPVIQYSPNEVKLGICGYGNAEKEQVQQMVTRLLRLAEVPRPPDAADALALAVCHLWGSSLQDAIAASGGRSKSQTHPSAGNGVNIGLSRAIDAALAKEAQR